MNPLCWLLGVVVGLGLYWAIEYVPALLRASWGRRKRICPNCRFGIEKGLPHYRRGPGSCSTAPPAFYSAPGGPLVRTLYHEHLQKGA